MPRPATSDLARHGIGQPGNIATGALHQARGSFDENERQLAPRWLKA
jgi:hypothetical protein